MSTDARPGTRRWSRRPRATSAPRPARAGWWRTSIRGKSVADAQAILAYSTRAAAVPVRKVLQSAIANADHNHGLDVRELRIVRVTVDEGPTIKRFRPRAKGRATPIMKRTCHITIGLAETGA